MSNTSAEQFYVLGVDVTEHCTLPELPGCIVIELRLILEGEATHICSLTPNSFYRSLGVHIEGVEPTERLADLEIELSQYAEDGYMAFTPYERCSFPKSELMRFDDWDQAYEYCQGNEPSLTTGRSR